MAAESVLAREYIEFATKGLAEAQQAIDKIKGGLDKTAASTDRTTRAFAFVGRLASLALGAPATLAGKLKAGLDTVASSLAGISSAAAKVAAGGAAYIGLITRAAMADSYEADQLSKVWTYFARVVGGIFAPAVRGVTDLLGQLAVWFEHLDSATKSSIANWSIITTAVAAFVAILPVVVTGIGAVVGVLGAILSPTMLVVTALIGGFAAVAMAAGGYWDEVTDAGEGAANSLQESNKTWISAMIKGIQAFTTAAAKAFNWIADHMAKISDKIAEFIAWVGESTGLLPEGTLKTLREMPAIKPIQIDIAGLDDVFAKLEKKAADLGEKFNFDVLKEKFKNIVAPIEKAFNPKPGDQQFRQKGQVKLENLSATWERLQVALADQENPMAVQKAQLGQLQQLREGQQQMLGDGIPLKGLNPAIA